MQAAPLILALLVCSGQGARVNMHGQVGKNHHSVGKQQKMKESDDSATDHSWIPIKTNECAGSCSAFVSNETGSDDGESGGSAEKPYKTIQYAVDQRVTGQTIYVMNGVYQNEKFGEGATNDPVVNLNKVKDLVIKNYVNVTTGEVHSPKLQFDASGGMIGRGVARVTIEGLEIEGVNANVSYTEAMEGRALKAPRLKGRGIAIWSGHHIQFQNMKVHHCPGSGLRVNKGDYVVLSDSEVYANCWWSSAAESGIVFAESKSVDKETGVKMIMRRNKVYDNMNKVPYYNPGYAWYKSPVATGKNCKVDACNPEVTPLPMKDCPWQCQYGKIYQDFIVDGMGVYVTRNNLEGASYTHGRMELSGNEAYGNGINGLVFHRTDRGSVINNLVYDNGVVPKNPADATEDWQIPLSKGRQPYAGITINNAHDVTLAGNTVSTMYDNDNAFTMEYDHGEVEDPVSDQSKWNKVCKGYNFDEKFGPEGLFVFPPVPDQCSDTMPGYGTKQGFTCATWSWAHDNKCNKDSKWTASNFCQRSCKLNGVGYDKFKDACCLPYH